MSHDHRNSRSSRSAALTACLVVAAIAVVGGACLPVLAGNPAVTPKSNGTVVATMPIAGSRVGEIGDMGFAPQLMAVQGQYGWVPKSDRKPSLRIAVQLPMLGGAGLDLYVQAPRGWLPGYDMGFGLMMPTGDSLALPYLSLGQRLKDGRGWFVHSGFLSRTDSAGQTKRALNATAGLRFTRSRVFLSGVTGRFGPCTHNGCTDSTRLWRISGGYAHDFKRRDSLPPQ